MVVLRQPTCGSFRTGHEACLVAGKNITTAIYNRLWLGGHRSAPTGKWVWGDGSSAETFLGGKWSSGQPTANVYLAISTFDGFSMLAFHSEYQLYYICEIDVVQ